MLLNKQTYHGCQKSGAQLAKKLPSSNRSAHCLDKFLCEHEGSP